MRFKILSKQQTIKTIITQYEKSVFKFLNEKRKIEEFISFLIGILLAIPIKDKKWEISHNNFDNIFKDYAKRFTNDSNTPLPTEFEDYQLTLAERDKIKCKKFVDEIHKINLEDEIIDAINDYCRTYKTIIGYFESSIVKSKDLEEYKKDLTKKLSSQRKLYKLRCNNNTNLIIPKSQEMYLDSMALDAKDFKGVSYNRVFFQHGIMHIIVDDGNLTWYLGDKL